MKNIILALIILPLFIVLNTIVLPLLISAVSYELCIVGLVILYSEIVLIPVLLGRYIWKKLKKQGEIQ